MKGQNTLTGVFVVMTIALLSVAWFQANSGAGTGASEQLISQYSIEETGLELQKTLSYIETSLRLSASSATLTTGNKSGREEKEQRYRYWLCQGESQPPGKQEVRNTLSEFTGGELLNTVNRIHGEGPVQNRYIGERKCIEPGYREGFQDPSNDNFPIAANFEKVRISGGNETESIDVNDFQPETRVNYNRFWYLYGVMKKWVEQDQEKMKDLVRQELEKIPDRPQVQTQGSCDTPTCPETESFWLPDHPERLEERIEDGVKKTVDRLESSDEYFNGNNVSCAYEFNTRENRVYPGYRTYSEGFNCKKVDAKGGCGECQQYANPCPDSSGTTDTSLGRDYRYTDDSITFVRGDDTDPDPGDPSEPPPPDDTCEEYDCSKSCTSDTCKNETWKKQCGFSNENCCSSYSQPQYCGEGNVCSGGQCVPCGENCVEYESSKRKAVSTGGLYWDTWVDVTVTCEDEKFESIPREELERLEWSIDLSFKVEERKLSNPFQCPGNSCPSPKSKEPMEFKTCEVDGGETLACETGAETVEEIG